MYTALGCVQPDNILVSTLGDQFKLADFGIATQLEGTVELAQTWVGTMAYMSPERLISGQGYGFPADVWAAGLSLLAVAAGAFPFPETSYWELIKYIKDDPAPLYIITGATPTASGTPAAGKPAPKVDCKPWSVPPSRDLCDFITQCLRKDPAARPTAEQLLSHPFITSHIDDANPGKRATAVREVPATRVLDHDGSALGGTVPVMPEGLYADVGVALTDRAAASKSKFPAAFSSRPPAEQDVIIQSLNEIVSCVVDTHWGGFLRYFRRYRHKRRKKWYYSLDETSFNAFLAERLAATGTMNATMARQMQAAVDNPAMQHALGRSSGIAIARVVRTQMPAAGADAGSAGAAGKKPPVSLTTTQAHAALAATVVTAKEVLLDLFDVRTLAAQLALPPLLVRTGFNDAITKRCDAVAAAKASTAAAAARNVPSQSTSGAPVSTAPSRSSSLRQKQADGVAQLQAQAAASREQSSLLAQAAALERSGQGSGLRTVLDDDDDDGAGGDAGARPSLLVGVAALPPTHHAAGRARGSDSGAKHGYTGSGSSSTGGAAMMSPAESAASSSSSASGRKTIHVSVPSSLTATPARRSTPPTGSAAAYTGMSSVSVASSSFASSAAQARSGTGFAFSPPLAAAVPPFGTPSRYTATEEYSAQSSSRDSRPGSGSTSRLSRAGASVIGPSSTPTPARTPTNGSKVERAVARLGDVEYAVDIPELPSAGGASRHSRMGGASGSATYTPKSGTSTPAGASFALPGSDGARGGSTASLAGRSIAGNGGMARYHLGGAS